MKHYRQNYHWQTTVALRAERIARRLGRALTHDEYERFERETTGHDELVLRGVCSRYPGLFRLTIARHGSSRWLVPERAA
jgi:hypothetical protein